MITPFTAFTAEDAVRIVEPVDAGNTKLTVAVASFSV